MFKNVASQKVALFAFTPADGLPKTGDAAQLTAYVSKDHGATTALTDTSATEKDATNDPGVYLFDLTQAETNADTLHFSGKSSTSGVKIVPLPNLATLPANFSAGVIDAAGNFAADVKEWAGTTIGLEHLGIIDIGTAQGAADSTHIQLRAAAAFTDDLIIGSTIYITGGSAGVGQSRVISDYVSSTDTALIDPPWTVTPTGTIIYLVIGTPPGTTTALPLVQLAPTTHTGAVVPTVTTTGTATAVTTVNGLAANVITAASIAADAVTEIQAGLATAAALNTVDDLLDTEVAAIVSSLSTISGFVDTEIATLVTELAKVPKSDGSVSLNATVLAAIQAGLALEVTLTSMKGATFSGATDSLEAIRDRGDAAWVTGSFSGLDAAATRAALGFASANFDTQVGAIAAKTVNLPPSPAAVGSAMTLTPGERTAILVEVQASNDWKKFLANVQGGFIFTPPVSYPGTGTLVLKQNQDGTGATLLTITLTYDANEVLITKTSV